METADPCRFAGGVSSLDEVSAALRQRARGKRLLTGSWVSDCGLVGHPGGHVEQAEARATKDNLRPGHLPDIAGSLPHFTRRNSDELRDPVPSSLDNEVLPDGLPGADAAVEVIELVHRAPPSAVAHMVRGAGLLQIKCTLTRSGARAPGRIRTCAPASGGRCSIP